MAAVAAVVGVCLGVHAGVPTVSGPRRTADTVGADLVGPAGVTTAPAVLDRVQVGADAIAAALPAAAGATTAPAVMERVQIGAPAAAAALAGRADRAAGSA